MITLAFEPPQIEWFRVAPLLALLAGASLMLLLGSLVPRWPRGGHAALTTVTCAVAAGFTVANWRAVDDGDVRSLVGGALAMDRLAVLLAFVTLVGTVMTAWLLDDHLRGEHHDGPEMYALLLTGAIGAIVLAAANDFLVQFLGLETLSLSLYLMVASNRRRSESQEAGLKYFILGGFASAFLLYGVAFVFGTTGSTSLSEVAGTLRAETFTSTSAAMLLVGTGLLMVGLAFKVSAVPFQSWTPDVYQGAPSPVTGLMASVAKAAAVAALVRTLFVALESRADDWRPVLWTLAVLSLVGGSVMAVVQTNVKRMLAFSSVSHVGFVLVGLEAAAHDGRRDSLGSVGTYLAVYSVLVIGSFAVVTVVGADRSGSTMLADFVGLGRRRPALAAALTVFLLAQAGMPATSGFVAKFSVISEAVRTGSYAVAITAMVSAVVAAYLYLRIMMTVWNGESDGTRDESPLRVPVGAGVVVATCAAFTVVVGVWPTWLLNLADSLGALAR